MRKNMSQLLNHWVVLLAMEHGRAPLPISLALRKGLMRRGLPNNVNELGVLALRYLFSGDAKTLLAELQSVSQSPSFSCRLPRTP